MRHFGAGFTPFTVVAVDRHAEVDRVVRYGQRSDRWQFTAVEQAVVVFPRLFDESFAAPLGDGCAEHSHQMDRRVPAAAATGSRADSAADADEPLSLRVDRENPGDRVGVERLSPAADGDALLADQSVPAHADDLLLVLNRGEFQRLDVAGRREALLVPSRAQTTAGASDHVSGKTEPLVCHDSDAVLQRAHFDGQFARPVGGSLAGFLFVQAAARTADTIVADVQSRAIVVVEHDVVAVGAATRRFQQKAPAW